METASETKLDSGKIEALKDFIKEVMEKPYADSYLIRVLHKTQELFGYLPRETMDVISVQMNIPTAHIWGVATFYHYFNLQPPGKHKVSVCIGTACYVKGAGRILDALKEELNVTEGEVTEDGLFCVEGARCLGACGLAPVAMVDDKIYGELTPEKMSKIIKEYRAKAETK